MSAASSSLTVTTRLTLFCHAATAATRAARFPADEPIDAKGEAALSAIAPAWRRIVERAERRLTAPALRARQTAAALDGEFVVEPLLGDQDYGPWTGLSLPEAEVRDPEAAAEWITDPASAPHGGERLVDVLQRVGDWLVETATTGNRVVVVTHAAVIRAAIVHTVRADPAGYWHVDVPPLARVDLSHDGRRWSLRALVTPIEP